MQAAPNLVGQRSLPLFSVPTIVRPRLLLLLGQAFGEMFLRLPQEKYDYLLRVVQAVGAERDYYQGQIQKFKKEMGTIKKSVK